ncbi:PqqD family protein [Bacillus sp. 7586-K]|uniref:lasso peptide biosynthesis PqqD family chaperone n=1 Tax=Metabacillus niabensis TaxID=324854 RepID=UPI000BA6062E|nr:PqqD family protein [Bacillus sp. 7586-K]
MGDIFEGPFYIKQKEGNIVSDMDGEKVMLSISNGKYYNLGKIGGVIWDLIEKPISYLELVDSLVNNYDVDRGECEQQVLSFLESLKKEELIEIKEGSIM